MFDIDCTAEYSCIDSQERTDAVVEGIVDNLDARDRSLPEIDEVASRAHILDDTT